MTASPDDPAVAATTAFSHPPLVHGVTLDEASTGATLRLPSGRAFRVSAQTAWLIRRLETPATWDDLASALTRRLGSTVTRDHARDLVHRLLIAPGIVRAEGPEPARSRDEAARVASGRPATLLNATWTRRLSGGLAPILARDVQGVTAAAAVAAHAAWLWGGDVIAMSLPAPAWQIPAVLLPAFLVHELGHAAACRAHGGEPRAIRMERTGRVSLELSGLEAMSGVERAAVITAGAVAQLVWGAAAIAAFAAFGAHPPALALIANMIVAAANLAPIDHRDGARLAFELAGAPRDPSGPQVADAPAAVRLRVAACIAAWGTAAWLVGLVAARLVSPRTPSPGEAIVLAAFLAGGVSVAVLATRLLRQLLGDEPDPANETAAFAIRLRAAAVFVVRALRAWTLVALAGGKMRRERRMLPALASFAFPDWSSRDLRRLGDHSAVSMELLEREHGDMARGELAHVQRNVEVARRLLRERRGAVFCALHFGPFHYVVRTLMTLRIQPVVFAARSTHAHWQRTWKLAVRPGEFDPLLLDPQQPSAALRAYRALRGGQLLVVYIDAHIAAGATDERRLPVRFLGQTLYMRAGPLMLAGRAGAPIVLAASPRRALGMRLVAFSDPLPPPEAEDDDALQRYLEERYAWFEPWVERTPEQWAGNLMRFDHWREVGAPPRVTAAAWEAERAAWRQRLERPGRARLIVDSARVGWFEAPGETRLIIDGPHGRVLKGSALALELLDAADRATPLARLGRSTRATDAVVDELSRLTLAGLVSVREPRRSPSAAISDPAPATPA